LDKGNDTSESEVGDEEVRVDMEEDKSNEDLTINQPRASEVNRLQDTKPGKKRSRTIPACYIRNKPPVKSGILVGFNDNNKSMSDSRLTEALRRIQGLSISEPVITAKQKTTSLYEWAPGVSHAKDEEKQKSLSGNSSSLGELIVKKKNHRQTFSGRKSYWISTSETSFSTEDGEITNQFGLNKNWNNGPDDDAADDASDDAADNQGDRPLKREDSFKSSTDCPIDSGSPPHIGPTSLLQRPPVIYNPAPIRPCSQPQPISRTAAPCIFADKLTSISAPLSGADQRLQKLNRKFPKGLAWFLPLQTLPKEGPCNKCELPNCRCAQVRPCDIRDVLDVPTALEQKKKDFIYNLEQRQRNLQIITAFRQEAHNLDAEASVFFHHNRRHAGNDIVSTNQLDHPFNHQLQLPEGTHKFKQRNKDLIQTSSMRAKFIQEKKKAKERQKMKIENRMKAELYKEKVLHKVLEKKAKR